MRPTIDRCRRTLKTDDQLRAPLIVLSAGLFLSGQAEAFLCQGNGSGFSTTVANDSSTFDTIEECVCFLKENYFLDPDAERQNAIADRACNRRKETPRPARPPAAQAAPPPSPAPPRQPARPAGTPAAEAEQGCLAPGEDGHPAWQAYESLERCVNSWTQVLAISPRAVALTGPKTNVNKMGACTGNTIGTCNAHVTLDKLNSKVRVTADAPRCARVTFFVDGLLTVSIVQNYQTEEDLLIFDRSKPIKLEQDNCVLLQPSE